MLSLLTLCAQRGVGGIGPPPSEHKVLAPGFETQCAPGITYFPPDFQRPQVMGHRVEMRIATLMQYNRSIFKFGIQLLNAGARVRCMEYVERNNDQCKWGKWRGGGVEKCISAVFSSKPQIPDHVCNQLLFNKK